MSDYLIQQNTDNLDGTHLTMKNTIIFNGSANDEMLKITPDGFYVRGVKVQQDEREAESVYKTFHQWLTWATLNRTF
jgi:hypothetical protein